MSLSFPFLVNLGRDKFSKTKKIKDLNIFALKINSYLSHHTIEQLSSDIKMKNYKIKTFGLTKLV